MNLNDQQFKIDLRYDAVFKAVFTKDTAESRGALTGLLSAFLERKVSVLFVAANELPLSGIRQRQTRFDIGVRFDNDELADIEMMLYPAVIYLRKRSLLCR